MFIPPSLANARRMVSNMGLAQYTIKTMVDSVVSFQEN